MTKSILQNDRYTCYLCGGEASYYDPLDEHHIFFGYNRDNSEKYGLKVRLHHSSCHLFGKNAVHNNPDLCRKLQSDAQVQAMKYYDWSIEDFRNIFGKNYLSDEAMAEIEGEEA